MTYTYTMYDSVTKITISYMTLLSLQTSREEQIDDTIYLFLKLKIVYLFLRKVISTNSSKIY